MASKLRIAVAAACPFPTLQGSQVLVRQFCEALSERGHQVHLVTYGYGQFPYHPTFDIHRTRDFTSYRRLSSGPSFMKVVLDLLLAFKLRKVCRRYGVQIISAHNYEAALLSAAVGRISGIPVVYHSHGLLSEELPTYCRSAIVRQFARGLGHLFDKYTPRWVSCNLVFSEQEKAVLENHGVPVGKIKVLPPGIALHDFQISGEPERSVSPTVVYAGNLDPYQNLPLILQAFRKVVQEIPEAKLTIASADDFTSLRETASRLEIDRHIELVKTNSFEQMRWCLAAAQVAVTGRTLSAGFPVKVLNYFAAGLPVVGFKSGAKGVKHLHDGHLVSDGDIEAFAGGVIELLRNRTLRRRLGAAAVREAEIYSRDKAVAEFESLCQRVLQRR